LKKLITALVSFAPACALSQDYGAWHEKNTDGNWTATAEAAVEASGLPASLPEDVEMFCPGYKGRSVSDRKKFWVGLLSVVAKLESNFKPESTYTESFVDSQGKKVISRGLLQISIESANHRKYACNIKAVEELHDPARNLACGVKILNAWVKTDNVIATYSNGPARGGGRYWSTLRERRKHLPEIIKFTRALNVCAV
jgi:hypothetical protein